MQIVTLTTDFGLRDYYAAVLKGALLSKNASLNIIDISHNINNYDIVQAAYIFKNSWASFPPGSIHLISVGECLISPQTYIIFQHKKHFFVGPDNGVFSLVFETLPKKIFKITNSKNLAPEQIYAEAISQISNQVALNKIGTGAPQIIERISLQAVISPSQIRGSVIYIDNYDNAIVNIEKGLFEQVGRKRSFSLFFKRNDPITKLSRYYSDVPVGEILCLFNSASYLEIAINMGKASSLLGLKVEDTVQIDFHN